jgi:hypothetical protein
MKPITAIAFLALIFACEASAKDKRQGAIKDAIDVQAAQQGAKEEDDPNAKQEAANAQRYWLRSAVVADGGGGGASAVLHSCAVLHFSRFW